MANLIQGKESKETTDRGVDSNIYVRSQSIDWTVGINRQLLLVVNIILLHLETGRLPVFPSLEAVSIEKKMRGLPIIESLIAVRNWQSYCRYQPYGEQGKKGSPPPKNYALIHFLSTGFGIFVALSN